MNHDSAVPVTASARTNILQIVGNAIVGGMENYVVRLVERLPRERFGVSVLAPFESPFTDQLRDVSGYALLESADTASTLEMTLETFQVRVLLMLNRLAVSWGFPGSAPTLA